MEVFSGTVYRNTNFAKNGTIEVMIHQKYRINGEDKSWKEYGTANEDKEANITKIEQALNDKDFGVKMVDDCLVLFSMATSYNSGMVQIPQVGTTGLVLYSSDPELWSGIQYFWLGGLYGDKQYGQRPTLPNDDTESEEFDYEDKPLISSGYNENIDDTISGSDYFTKGQFLIKTKTCDVADYSDAEVFNHSKIPSENTFVLKKDKAALRHNTYNDNKEKTGISQLLINDENLNIKRKIKLSDSSNLEQNITFDNSQILVKQVNDDKSSESTVVISADGTVKISTTGDIEATADKNINLDAGGDLNISSRGQMSIKSDQKMTISGVNQNLLNIIYQLAEDVKNLTTQGSPGFQSATPATGAMIATVENLINAGYNK